MKKYKLIKTYPNSPPLNSYTCKGDVNVPCKVYTPQNTVYSTSFGWNWIENYPEYWEEIIEKEEGYKILTRLNDKIKSVIRLTDYEIFTIGDNCEYGIITDIFVTREGYCMTGTKSSPYSCNILYLKHNKKPLFTTEDGVDVFENNICFSIFKKNYEYSGQHSWEQREWFTKTSLDSNKLYFSTKEKAQEYIDLHKPKYSLMDIKNSLMSTTITYVQHQILQQNLKQLNK